MLIFNLYVGAGFTLRRREACAYRRPTDTRRRSSNDRSSNDRSSNDRSSNDRSSNDRS
jgi:hypothetical protein